MAATLQGQEYLDHLAQFDQWNARAFLGILITFGFPTSHLDVGCGTGAMVRMARRVGVPSTGLDIISNVGMILPEFYCVDASKPFELKRRFSLITCIEVGEHIPSALVGTFAENIVRHMADESMLVFTAASPGQAGEGHLTLLRSYEWRSMFHDLGAKYNEEFTMRLKAVWNVIPMPMMWLPDNLQVFIKP